MARLRLGAAFVFVQLLFVANPSAGKTHNLGFDHRAHSVPGADKFTYDLDDNGSELVELDGSGSHSHYFDPGPPVKSGLVEGYEWVNVKNDTVVCSQKKCSLLFPVGVTTVKLRIWDNTGDTAEDKIVITVLPKSKAKKAPYIKNVNPNKGSERGENLVSIMGANLYHDSVVYFGGTKALNIKHVDLNTIVCTAPEGTGKQKISIKSSIGNSNTVDYQYQKSSAIPIQFEKAFWKKPNKSFWRGTQITGIVIGKDHRYYMSSRTGTVTAAKVAKNLVVTESCTGAGMGPGRAIAGIGFNPMDPQHRLFVTTNTYYHKKSKQRWDNAKVESVYVDKDGCPVRGDVIISGLPVSNHDHGTNKIIFDGRGRMLISVGSTSNAGASRPGDGIGGVPESPLSGAIVEADYMRPGFDGEIKYNQYHRPGQARIISGDVRVYASGLRNCFGMTRHANGQIYATDNGPNIGFGKSSVTCWKEGPDVEAEDKLVRILRGKYYGHPNRNRGRTDKRQCTYRHPWDPTGGGYVEPMGWMKSSTNGIIDYRAHNFQGILRGNLFMSKVAFAEKGTLYRAELSDDGTWLEAGPYEFKDYSGLSLVQGLWGELVMPLLEQSKVLVYKPVEATPSTVQFLNVYPNSGPKQGGTEIIVTGHHLNGADLQIFVGEKECTGIWDVYYNSVKCTTPPGSGKVYITVKQGGVESSGYGRDFEYF